MPDYLTPSEAAEVLGVSGPTIRRFAAAWEAERGPLVRDDRGARCWTVEALNQVKAAHQALATGRVTSLAHGLKIIAEGRELPSRPDLPARLPERLAADTLENILAELHALRTEVAALREERALPAPVVDHSVELAALQGEVERLRVALVTVTPQPQPRRGLLARLLGLV